VKTVADRHGHAALVTNFLVVSTSMTLKTMNSLFLAIFGCAAHFKSELQRNG